MNSFITSLEKRLKVNIKSQNIKPVIGGSINKSYQIILNDQMLFCKVNSKTKYPDLFKKEVNGLEILKQNSVKVPKVFDCFETDDEQILILNFINEGERTPEFWKLFGHNLALMHNNKADKFGLNEWNYMGAVEQKNEYEKDWKVFFINKRLKPILNYCSHHFTNKDLSCFHILFERMQLFFDPFEKPSLVHGDLWSGNFLCDHQNSPVLIDPAIYYGHPSIDLAMTTLFGGFPNSFYESYQYYHPLSSNYKEQWQICNLYPLLIHLHLFGSAYINPIRIILQQFC